MLPAVGVVRPERDGLVVDYDGTQEDAADLLAELVRRGLRPIEFAVNAPDLEDIFLELTEGRVQ